MTPQKAISTLDAALRQAGEDIILRRSGSPDDDVTCRARVDTATAEQILAGVPASDLNIIVSPTQIVNAGWGGGETGSAPFIVDQSVPRAGVTDKVLLRGQAPRAVSFVKPFYINGTIVRIEMRVSG
jgi:hypothetical protein